MQILHHASVYGSGSCIFIVGDKRRYLYSVEIVFPEELLESYMNILQLIYDRGLKWARSEGNNLPEIPKAVVDAFQSKKTQVTQHDKRCIILSYRTVER